MKEQFVIAYDSPLLKGNFLRIKYLQGWGIHLDADNQQAIFTR